MRALEPWFHRAGAWAAGCGQAGLLLAANSACSADDPLADVAPLRSEPESGASDDGVFGPGGPSSQAESPPPGSGAPEPAGSSPGLVAEDEHPLVLDECDEGACAGGSQTMTPPDCGDGELTEDEACDDGNRVSGDGCAANCLATEPGFSCAAPGQPCQAIARCGDGLVASSEQCDDQNVEAGDGCSERCRVERGKKCEGEPSVCSDTVCGDGIVEGAEACDDGNTMPFDGCSPACEKEPNCAGASCTSDCGDGLVINEECDDGNQLDGDGCSSTCRIEAGFTCAPRASDCERVAGLCVLRVPVVYRDFSDEHPDFGGHRCNDLALGALAPELGADGRPRLGDPASVADACLSTEQNLADWYVDSEHSVPLVSELVLFDNEAGGYVNRFGAEGQRFEAVDPASERNGGASLAACEETCISHARNGEAPMFDAPLRCEDVCRPIEQEASALVSGELSQLQGELNRASDAVPRDDALIAEIEEAMAVAREQLSELEAAVETCGADCASALSLRVEQCAATCQPCSRAPDRFCIGGQSVAFDGTPLFFPVDSIAGDTEGRAPALIPPQYGYSNWPWEDEVFPDAQDHNFFFTSEVRHWFRYDATTNATLDFLGDDDVWVFINGKLAVDLGGVHAPASGTVAIDAAAGSVNAVVSDGLAGGVEVASESTTEDFGLVAGNVYEITIFHAERRLNGSSFKLTLAGFDATPSECTAICGDGVLSFGEECDDGTNDGGYGMCDAGCRLGPFCGDGIVQSEFGEDCDDGPAGSATCTGCRVLRVRVR